jgi:predicted phage terminase large subunit-like protein
MWVPYKHLLLINEKLLDVMAGKIKRLMIQMPPRHGKSELTSRYFPAWALLKNPNLKIILASYEGDFAAGWGRKVRDVIDEHGKELAGISVRKDSSAASRWHIAGRWGEMNTAGVGGPITGKGADILLIDDPVKDWADALSEVERKKKWNWYLSTAKTRLQKNAAQILIMTRWHEEDLAGSIEAAVKRGDEPPWEVLRLPAIAEVDEDYGFWKRQKGEALCPDLIPLEMLLSMKKAALVWAGLYQQRPAPMEGGTIKRKWFRHYEIERDATFKPTGWIKLDGIRLRPMDHTRFVTTDLATSIRTMADYTVHAVWCLYQSFSGPWLILLDIFREQVEGPDILPPARTLCRRWKCPIWMEKAGFQLSMIQTARRKGFPVRELIADKDKLARAIMATPLMEAGGFWLPESASWLADYESELLTFPNGKHDDQVDVTAYAAQLAFGFGGGGLTIGSAGGDNRHRTTTFEGMIPNAGPEQSETDRGFFSR